MGGRGLVIFDLDGTLFRADAVTLPAAQRAFREQGLPAPSEEEVRRFIGKPTPQFHAWLADVCPAGAGAAVAEALDRYEIELVHQVGELYPGVWEALEGLRRRAAAMAVCTNGPRPYVDAVMESRGLRPFFDLVLDAQSGHGGKAGMVRAVLAQTPERPGAVVGDRADDVEAARANGLKAVGVTYGIGSPDELGSADVLVHSPGELCRVVSGLLDGQREHNR